MINVGDKFILNNENWEVIFIDDDSVAVARSENGEEGIVSQRTIYKYWYEQQKQRADELSESNKWLLNRVDDLQETIENLHDNNLSDLVTYIRVNINDKWTNLGIVAEEDEIQEHFEFVDGLLKQKQRANELEKRWSELKQMGIETYSNLKKDKSVLAQYIGSILCVMDELEGKENVFETVQQLEEDNNAGHYQVRE
ncbi:hypothetical protein [Macrococcus armenti]|uniref:hypothetical protein n=1 Tax=Macrococcus armenti TaxID=2875764 RepID=UPI001CC9CB63|nr:hypothetical protein [Macrococcus armenti]UBH14866.1 hypothetical protein LAU44_08860 [Macrococcus armenti]UBH19491.1 hypothetical protein LAU40_08870 [Macrococcus armenti]